MMDVKVDGVIDGLYPEERDYILKKLELIKKVYPNIKCNYSLLKSKLNNIVITDSLDNMDDVVGLVELLLAIKIPDIRTCYDDYVPLDERGVPCMDINIDIDIVFEEYNTDKGMMV